MLALVYRRRAYGQPIRGGHVRTRRGSHSGETPLSRTQRGAHSGETPLAALACRSSSCALEPSRGHRYLSIMTVTSIGYGEMLPVTTTERLVNTFQMLSSSMVWCYVMGQACSIAATMDPDGNEFKQNLDALNIFMHERGAHK